MTDLIFDFVENVRGKTPDKVIHVEDVIETPPEGAPENTSPVFYQLFQVEYDDKKEYFIHVNTNASSVLLPANQATDLVEEFFPDIKETLASTADQPHDQV